MRARKWIFVSLSGVLVFAVMFSLTGCGEENPRIAELEPIPPPVAVRPAADEADVEKIAQANNAFATDLYAQLSAGDGNLFFSPTSIFAALSMTAAGARGQTEAEMIKTLHHPLPRGKVHPAIGAMLYDMAAPQNPKVRLAIANALWAQKDYPFLKTYLGPVQKNYGAELQNLDFTATEKARRIINTWVEERTQDKIKELIKKGVITFDTRLVLTNAIYFRADWADPFEKDATSDAAFTLLDGTTVQAPMMNKKAMYNYAQTENLQALALPYEGGELSMLILLPRKKNGLPELEKTFSAKSLKEIVSRLDRKPDVDLYLPRFKMTVAFDLKKTLIALGMAEAFGMKADFSGMTGNMDLFITAVVHKAYVDVNEEGTEAAAATAVMVAECTAMQPTVFRADHPFLFLIRHNQTGAVLFMGRCMNPTDTGE